MGNRSCLCCQSHQISWGYKLDPVHPLARMFARFTALPGNLCTYPPCCNHSGNQRPRASVKRPFPTATSGYFVDLTTGRGCFCLCTHQEPIRFSLNRDPPSPNTLAPRRGQQRAERRLISFMGLFLQNDGSFFYAPFLSRRIAKTMGMSDWTLHDFVCTIEKTRTPLTSERQFF